MIDLPRPADGTRGDAPVHVRILAKMRQSACGDRESRHNWFWRIEGVELMFRVEMQKFTKRGTSLGLWAKKRGSVTNSRGGLCVGLGLHPDGSRHSPA